MVVNLDRLVATIESYNAKLLPVVKNKQSHEIKFLYDYGFSEFAENKINDFEIHSKDFNDVAYHYIAPVQTNKISKLVNGFKYVHTLSREKEVINFSKYNIENLSFFIQINVDNDPNKNGVSKESVLNFYDFCNENKISISGLMTIPNINSDPKIIYKSMYEINETLKIKDRNYQGKLSMGMSEDFQIALDYGATIVRIGSLLFK